MATIKNVMKTLPSMPQGRISQVRTTDLCAEPGPLALNLGQPWGPVPLSSSQLATQLMSEVTQDPRTRSLYFW